MSQWPIAELIPHAADMILIDEVVSFGAEDIETRLTVRPGGLFNQQDGSLPAWVGIELMAQSVAAYAGCQARQAGLPVELGFLLGTRKFECNVERFPAGAELQLLDAAAELDQFGAQGRIVGLPHIAGDQMIG